LFDAFVLVSNWQQQCYVERFAFDPARCRVLRNAPGPPFAQLFADGGQAAAAKVWPPVLAYTSTPFRGLDLLLDLFPAVRRAVPGTQLQVFSSMQVYRVPAGKDSADYGHLYRQCLETEGVEYVGSLGQADLAEALRGVTLLAYPNHFAETSCIAVMEALAAGLRVVTSHLGALPETLAGLGTLVPVDGNWQAYRQRFATEVVGLLESIAARGDEAQDHLARQIAFSRQTGSWHRRAREWSDWLSDLTLTLPSP
jgi:glycosyltransferase involved in cell wall biosynthesis